ncbi:MAG: DUF6520 family protein [Bacteroidota bacterium]|nr:DUF6520 family protein [Bacteroidota bacterium]
MKRFIIFIFAAVLAVGFSAFTNPHKKETTYYYKDHTDQWQDISSLLVGCDPGEVTPCTEFLDGANRQIYVSKDPLVELKYGH